MAGGQLIDSETRSARVERPGGLTDHLRMTLSTQGAGMADQPSDREAPTPAESDVVLAVAGRRICARVFEPGRGSGPRPGVLFIHGLGSDQPGSWPRAEATVGAFHAVCLK